MNILLANSSRMMLFSSLTQALTFVALCLPTRRWSHKGDLNIALRKDKTSCVYALTGSPKARANPKSASFSCCKDAFSRMFCGLRSLCRTLQAKGIRCTP